MRADPRPLTPVLHPAPAPHADVGKTRRLRSTIIQNSHEPVWNQRATVYLADEAEDLTVEVKVRDSCCLMCRGGRRGARA